MSKKTEIKPVVIEEEVALALKADANDIANIGVAEYENRLREKLNVTRKEWKAERKALDKLEKELEKSCEQRVKSFYAKKVDALVVALQGLGATDEPVLECGSYKADKDWITASIRSVMEGGRAVLKPVKATAAIKTCYEKIQDMSEKVKELASAIVNLQSEIGNIGYAERQIRAKVSAHILKTSDNGKALLSAIRSADFVPQLPA